MKLFFIEFCQFLIKRKKLFLIPPLLIFVLLGIILIFFENSAVAPFIYSLF